MEGQILFEGKLRYHISGMRIAIFLLMAMLAGIVMFLCGLSGALDGFILTMLAVFVGLPISVLLLITASQISTVKNRSLTITADGKKYTIRELDNADDFAQAVRERIRGMMQERAAALQMQTAHMQNPEDQFHAAEHLLQQGKITPEQFNSMQQMQ